jgi:hypothetical protein
MNMKRMRGRNHRPNGGGGGGGGGFRNQQNGIPLNRNHVFDSSGPEMRVRGTAQQLFEKYTQMARDASSNGDRVTGEAYYQHAEHYFRIISAINQAQGQPPAPNGATGERPPYQQNGEQRPYNNQGHQNQGNGEYNRQDEAPREEFRQQEPRPQEPRQDRQERRFEPRNDRQGDRPYEPRSYERKEFERKPEFQPRPPRTENGFRNEPPADHRIDISSALEAELAAAAEPAGFGEQPALPIAEPVAEARAIPIISDAPPQAAGPALATPEAAVRTPRPRGRPRLVKETPPEDSQAG